MKALIDKYSFYFLAACVLLLGISIYLLRIRAKGENFARYAYSPADSEAFEKIVAWIKTYNPNEYAWWRNNIALYMPGAPRDNMFGIEVPDMPDGTTSLTKRLIVASYELPWKDQLAQGAAAVHNAVENKFYNDFLKTV